MGQRGPRPVPTAVLKARGSARAGKNKKEPAPPPGRPACPDWLDDEAKQVWAQVIPLLEEMGVLTRADTNALARYCQLFARWKKAELFIQRFGESYPCKSGNGIVKCFLPFPQSGLSLKLSIALTRLEQEFGLTPSARSRIEVDPEFGLSDERREARAAVLESMGVPLQA
jgi:P27 family predicted phage terminase small subunit